MLLSRANTPSTCVDALFIARPSGEHRGATLCSNGDEDDLGPRVAARKIDVLRISEGDVGRKRKTERNPDGPRRAIAYTRVSSEEQGRSGLGLEAQRQAISRAAEYHGWDLAESFQDVASGRSTNGRPGLDRAIACVGARECADILVVSRLNRLSRSVSDFARLMERARGAGWSVVALDLNIDTTSATGEMQANMLAVLAQWERRLIGERTRDALAAKKRQGVRLGRPVGPGFESIPGDVRRRIRNLGRRGHGPTEIARRLAADGVPTARGGAWRASTVQQVLDGSQS